MILNLLRIALYSCLLYTGFGFASPAEQDAMKIGMVDDLYLHQRTRVFLEQAYKVAGIEVSFISLPSGRALYDANRGHLDGDAGRILDIEKLYPNLVPVPTPIISVSASVFVIDDIPEIQTWEELKPFRIGIMRGAVYAERGTEGLFPLRANNYQHLFKLLVAGRIDVAISVSGNAQAVIAKSFPESGIYAQEKPLHVDTIYHFLHKKHQHLIPTLDKAFQQTLNSQ